MRRFIGGLAMLLALVPAITIAVPAVSTPVAPDRPARSIPVADPAAYDTFGAVTVNPVVNGQEQPLVAAGSWTTQTFSTAGFTVQQAPIKENGNNPNYNGCIVAPGTAQFVGRTAWLRINPGVDGKVGILASTGYDAQMNLFGANKAPYGGATLANLTGSITCSYLAAAGATERIGTNCPSGACFQVTRDHDYYVQVGVICPTQNDPSSCQETNGALPAGGDTVLQFTFVPDDSDADGVPDSQDQCPSVAGQASAQGCPDADGDGIQDSQDNCPTDAGVPASAPYNGCPAGPTPPDVGNPPYVTILSPTGDVDTTNDTSVTLKLNWPQGAQTMRISNGDSTFTAPIRISSATYPWTLRPLSSGQSSASRDVKVVFQGPGIKDNSQDDSITLDTVRPAGVGGEFSAMAKKGWHFFVRGKDQGTGVRKIQMLDAGRKTLKTKNFCTKTCSSSERVGLFSAKKPVYARVFDLAGNQRVVRLQRSQASCAFPPYKVYKVNSTKSGCFALHQKCNPAPGVWDWKHADVPLACRPAGDVHQVELR